MSAAFFPLYAGSAIKAAPNGPVSASPSPHRRSPPAERAHQAGADRSRTWTCCVKTRRSRRRPTSPSGRGCSVRSVFERFSDLLTLSFAAADYAFAQGMAQAVARNVDGDRQTRLKSQVETRAAVCERWLPLWRALLRHQHESDELAFRIERMRDAVVGRLQLMYQAGTFDPVGSGAQGGVDRPGGPDRFRELGAAA